jgi:hypothetical protein
MTHKPPVLQVSRMQFLLHTCAACDIHFIHESVDSTTRERREHQCSHQPTHRAPPHTQFYSLCTHKPIHIYISIDTHKILRGKKTRLSWTFLTPRSSPAKTKHAKRNGVEERSLTHTANHITFDLPSTNRFKSIFCLNSILIDRQREKQKRKVHHFWGRP